MWKAHTVSAVSTAHCVIKTSFLKQCSGELRREAVAIEMLGPWLGGMAAETGKRVVYSPFMRARVKSADAAAVPRGRNGALVVALLVAASRQAILLATTWIDPETAYVPVSEQARLNHLRGLQRRALPYEEWLTNDLRSRHARYPTPASPATISIVTPVYNGSDLDLLDELALTISRQTLKPSSMAANREWTDARALAGDDPAPCRR